VDYEDEDEDVPAGLGINGKNSGGVFEKKSENLLPTSSLTDAIWQDVDDGSIAKRKTPLAPGLEETDSTPPKRQKPEDGHSVDHDNQSGLSDLVDTSRVGSDAASSEVLGLAESVIPTSASPATQDISAKVEDSKATAAEQHGSSAIHQASSSSHISRGNFEATPDVGSEHPHQDLHTAPSDPDSVPPRGRVGLVATEAQLLNDVPVETAATTASEAGKVAASSGDDVRETCGNGGESPAKSLEVVCSVATERGSFENGMDCCSVEDCNGFASESAEKVGLGAAVPIDGSNNSLSQQHNVSLGSEGNKHIMRTVSPTSPGSYTVR
jgi:hypothetical protein